MAETALPQPPGLDLGTIPADDPSFTISKLKAASESLRCFNDALTWIGEAEADTGERLQKQPPPTTSSGD